MIQIVDKSQCCGCGACVQRCPKQCIVMTEDEEGFLYPKVDTLSCIDCGLCEKVCPEQNIMLKREPLHCYAAYNLDETIRFQSSSGGIFTLLAEAVLKKGGVVFGARFNEQWTVVHDFTESKDNLSLFRGSKYMQSEINNTFLQVERFLKNLRLVLFTGTPCQIAALKKFLRKEYDNLITLEIVCHGVPSPLMWKSFLCEKKRKLKADKILDISFRNKDTGWNGYSVTIKYRKQGSKKDFVFSEPYSENFYMRGFLSDIYIRPSCYKCSFKELKSGADITLGDFWGIQNVMPEFNDNKGVCCTLVTSKKGITLFNMISAKIKECMFCDIIQGNPAIMKSAKMNVDRSNFFSLYYENNSFIKSIDRFVSDSFLLRIKKNTYKLLRKFYLR